MIRIGILNKLKVANFTAFGAYLDAETGNRADNILLPQKQLPPDAVVGDELEVFIYRDSENRLIATTRKPLAMVGDLAYLKVTAKTPLGAFLDIGLERGLFLPFREQKYAIEAEKSYLVYLYLDKSERICCTTDIYKHLSADSPYVQNDKVQATVYSVQPETGAFVAVDDRYKGLIPGNEYFTVLQPGDRISARVIRVREDGKLDLSARELAHKQQGVDAELLIGLMEANKGYLPVSEKDSPEIIEKTLQMSKAGFKRAIGTLLKERRIVKTEQGIRLKSPDE